MRALPETGPKTAHWLKEAMAFPGGRDFSKALNFSG